MTKNRYHIGFGQLKNGLRYLYRPHYRVNISGVGVCAGSIHTPRGKVGLPHLTEHIIGCKTNLFDEESVALYYEKYLGGPGGNDNTRIDQTSTFYGHEDILYRMHQQHIFDQYARQLCDIMINPERLGPDDLRMDPDRLAIERAAVRNETLLYGDDALSEFLDLKWNKLLYRKNPARYRVDSEVADLRTITVADIHAFMREQYVPANMFVLTVGRSREETKHLAEKYFGDLPSGEVPKLRYDGSDNFPRLRRSRFLDIERPGISQNHTILGFPTESFHTPDAEALDVLARLWQYRSRRRIRGKNLNFDAGSYRVFAFNPKTFLSGSIQIWFATTARNEHGRLIRGHRERSEQLSEIALEEAHRLREELVSAREFDAMQSSLIYSYDDMYSNIPSELAEDMIACIVNGDERCVGLMHFKDKMRKVTRKKVRDMANKYFTDEFVRARLIAA